MSSHEETKNIQGQDIPPGDIHPPQENHKNLVVTQLNRQLTSSKWIATAEFLKDQTRQKATMTVATFYDHKGRDTVFAMTKNTQSLHTESFTVPHGLTTVHNYGPKEYRKWVEKKFQATQGTVTQTDGNIH